MTHQVDKFCVVIPTRNAPAERCVDMAERMLAAARAASFRFPLKIMFLVNDSEAGFSDMLGEFLADKLPKGSDVDVVLSDQDYATVEESIRKNLARCRDSLPDTFIVIGNSDFVDFAHLNTALDFIHQAKLDLLLVGLNNFESWQDKIMRCLYATPPLSLFGKNNFLHLGGCYGVDVFKRATLDYGPVDYLAYIGCQIYTKRFFLDSCQWNVREQLYALPMATLELASRQTYFVGYTPLAVAIRIDALHYGPSDPTPPPNWWITECRTKKGLSKDVNMSVITSSLGLNDNAFETLVQAQMLSICRGYGHYVMRPYLNHSVRQFFQTFVRSQKEPIFRLAANEVDDIINFGARLEKVDIGLSSGDQGKVCAWLKNFGVTEGRGSLADLRAWIMEAESVFRTLDSRHMPEAA